MSLADALEQVITKEADALLPHQRKIYDSTEKIVLAGGVKGTGKTRASILAILKPLPEAIRKNIRASVWVICARETQGGNHVDELKSILAPLSMDPEEGGLGKFIRLRAGGVPYIQSITPTVSVKVEILNNRTGIEKFKSVNILAAFADEAHNLTMNQFTTILGRLRGQSTGEGTGLTTMPQPRLFLAMNTDGSAYSSVVLYQLYRPYFNENPATDPERRFLFLKEEVAGKPLWFWKLTHHIYGTSFEKPELPHEQQPKQFRYLHFQGRHIVDAEYREMLRGEVAPDELLLFDQSAIPNPRAAQNYFNNSNIRYFGSPEPNGEHYGENFLSRCTVTFLVMDAAHIMADGAEDFDKSSGDATVVAAYALYQDCLVLLEVYHSRKTRRDQWLNYIGKMRQRYAARILLSEKDSYSRTMRDFVRGDYPDIDCIEMEFCQKAGDKDAKHNKLANAAKLSNYGRLFMIHDKFCPDAIHCYEELSQYGNPETKNKNDDFLDTLGIAANYIVNRRGVDPLAFKNIAPNKGDYLDLSTIPSLPAVIAKPLMLPNSQMSVVRFNAGEGRFV